MQVACPHCEKVYELAGTLAGKKVKCGRCQGSFQAPLPQGVPVAVRPPSTTESFPIPSTFDEDEPDYLFEPPK